MAPPHSSSTQQAVELPGGGAGPSHGGTAVSFGIPPYNQMSIAATEGELESFGNKDSAVFPPSGRVALLEPDTELTAMLSQAAERVGLERSPPQYPATLRLDDWYPHWFSALHPSAILSGVA